MLLQQEHAGITKALDLAVFLTNSQQIFAERQAQFGLSFWDTSTDETQIRFTPCRRAWIIRREFWYVLSKINVVCFQEHSNVAD